MAKIIKKLNNQSGELIIAVSVGVMIFSFAFLAVQDFGQTYVQPYLDAKNNNPDAVISIELSGTPRYESYIIENGVIENRDYIENNDEIQSVYDEDSVSARRYEGPRNKAPKNVIPIKPKVYEGPMVFDDGTTSDDMFPPGDEGDKWSTGKGQEKLLKIAGLLVNKNESPLNDFNAKNFLENISSAENADIDKDIKNTVEDLVVQSSTRDGQSSENKNIIRSTLDRIYENFKNSGTQITQKSEDIFNFIKEELKKKQLLAEMELINLRKEAEKLKISRDYNKEIINKYEQLESGDYTVADPAEWAEAKRRYEQALQDIILVEEKINNIEGQDIAAAQSSSSAIGEDQYADTTTTFYFEETTTTNTNSEETTTTIIDSGETTTSSAANLPSNVTLKGGFEEGPGSIVLNIDLKTGLVTGKVSSSTSAEGYEMSWSGDLKGNINLESLEITGTGKGLVKVQGIEGGDTGTLDCTFSGRLKNDATYASGSMTYTETWYGSTLSDNLSWYASK